MDLNKIRKMIHTVEGFFICFIALSSEAAPDSRAVSAIREPCIFFLYFLFQSIIRLVYKNRNGKVGDPGRTHA